MTLLIKKFGGTSVGNITKIKEILTGRDDVQYQIQGVYGVYDIIIKLSSASSDVLRSIITNDIRKINNIQSTLTMTVIEKEEGS